MKFKLYKESHKMGTIYNDVMEQYKKNDAELSIEFFNFRTNSVTYAKIFDEYKSLQKDINGDDVLLLCQIRTQENRIVSAGHWSMMEKVIYNNLKKKFTEGETIAEVLHKIKDIARDIIEQIYPELMTEKFGIPIAENECALCRVRGIIFDTEFTDIAIDGEILPLLY